MDDIELDRALKSALSVSPSPEFVARVRQGIAQSQPAPVFGGWLKTAAVSVPAIAVVGVIVITSRTTETDPALPILRSRAMAGFTAEPSVTRPGFVAVSAPAGSSDSAELTSRPRRTSLPEVLIDHEQVRAIHDLAVAARERRFEVIFSNRPPSDPVMTTDLSVAPLDIEPLNSPDHVNN